MNWRRRAPNGPHDDEPCAETIHDPAVYAVLIERSGGQYAAELPFEFCGQANGDLLPTGLFGDGPNPVNGDDQ